MLNLFQHLPQRPQAVLRIGSECEPITGGRGFFVDLRMPANKIQNTANRFGVMPVYNRTSMPSRAKNASVEPVRPGSQKTSASSSICLSVREGS